MLKSSLLALGIVGAGLVPASAMTVVMEFDEVASNGLPFDDTIGDSVGVDVTNRTRMEFGNSDIFDEALLHWTNNYSELVDIAYPAANGRVGELQFDIATGKQITIDRFDFGNYVNGQFPRNVSFYIYDSSWNSV